jgi:hypothetical protein
LRSQGRSADFLIEGLIPPRTLGIVVGDSGLGKSPLLYQTSLCIAWGVPFLGHAVRRGRVLYLDFENSRMQSDEIISRLARHLGVGGETENLLVWNFSDCAPKWGQTGHTALDMILDVKPRLAIVDSLASFDPDLEEKNSNAARAYRNFRKVIRDADTAIICVHHLKKPPSGPGQDDREPLETANLRRWFVQARGASVLINGADVRLAVHEPSTPSRQLKGSRVQLLNEEEKAALVMRGFGRVRGDIPLIYVARVLDVDDGEPLGYRRMVGVDLLFNEDQEECFNRLPEGFTFKEAKLAYGKLDQATRDFLKKCVGIGILRQPAKGYYQKVKMAE